LHIAVGKHFSYVALTDALIGAAGMGDIGKMFPDSDMQYKDISSAELLTRTLKAIDPKRILNADCTVIAQQPRLCGYTDAMCCAIAKLLGCDASRVNVKATTEEGLGFTGRCEGIAAHAVVLMEVYGED
ncbi:MAG TPA: 2-C-methyl-D-erythritol 2,4-cyclodiphosphate synthase, partial [Bacillota bacterium]|nr:2-C-methyl-D-erythritol 2,4-cyclodiphosphate synthase [Bacillota bacterium]